jgi:hypothetical protein
VIDSIKLEILELMRKKEEYEWRRKKREGKREREEKKEGLRKDHYTSTNKRSNTLNNCGPSKPITLLTYSTLPKLIILQLLWLRI